VLALARLIWEKLRPGVPFQVEHDPPYEHDVQRRVPEVSKARRILGYQARTPLLAMLDEVIPWIREQIDLGNI
jgi:UDP-glucose 4-epimerase